MKKINFKKLAIANFLSVGKEPIVINFKDGINIITGQNLDKSLDGNGVGKSSIIDSFYFAIFGSTLRDLKKEEIVNKMYKKNCAVTLEFDIDQNGTVSSYKIERGISPSFCNIYINGSKPEEKTLSGIPAMNEYILNLINSTPSVFKNTITTGINNSIPFMGQKKNEKREFVEGILRLEICKVMSKLAKEKYTDFSTKYMMAVKSLEDITNNIARYTISRDEFEDLRIVNLVNLQTRLKGIEDTIVSYKATLITIDDEMYIECLKEKATLKDMFRLAELDFIEKTKKVYSIENNITIVKNRISDITEEIKRLKVEYDKYPKFEGSVKSLEDCEKMQNDISTKLDTIPAQMANLKRDCDDIKKTIKTMKDIGTFCYKCKRPFPENSYEANKEKINQWDADIRTAEDKYVELSKEKDDLKLRQLKIDVIIKIMKLNNEKKELDKKLTTSTDLDKYTKEVENAQATKNEIGEKINVNQQVYQDIQIKIEKNMNTGILIENSEREKQLCKNDITALKDSSNKFIPLIDEAIVKKTELDNNVNKYKELMAIYDVIKFATSDEGIKSYIIKKMLPILNERINYYLGKMDANCTLVFDEYFEDKITNDRDVECSYYNFSGGERRRIDLACLFSFMDLRRIQGDVSFNLTFYDELLDSALSVEGSTKVFDILKERLDKYSENSYIITHRKENLKSPLINDIIFLEKSAGTTKLSKYAGK